MDKVYIAGIGQTAVGEHWEQSLANLSAEAILAALKEAGNPQVDALYAGNLLASAASNQANIGTLIASNAGLDRRGNVHRGSRRSIRRSRAAHGLPGGAVRICAHRAGCGGGKIYRYGWAAGSKA